MSLRLRFPEAEPGTRIQSTELLRGSSSVKKKKKSLREWRGEDGEEERARKAANSGSLLPEPGPWCRGRLGAQSYLTLTTQLQDFCTPVLVSHWLGPPRGGVGDSNFRIRWAPISQGLSFRGEINWKATVLASRHG